MNPDDSWWLDPPELIQLVKLGPLVSIDLIVRDPQGRMLVGLRANQPAKGVWFVPGGRVGKGESLDRAFLRIVQQELGITIPRSEAHLLGVFEHYYKENFLGEADVGTHYIVLAHSLRVSDPSALAMDAQHEHVRWLSPSELLADDSVHPNTKAYAQPKHATGSD